MFREFSGFIIAGAMISLTACSGGGGGGGSGGPVNTPTSTPVPSNTPASTAVATPLPTGIQISLDRSFTNPLEKVRLFIDNYDPSASYVISIDIAEGGAFGLQLPPIEIAVTPGSGSEVSFNAPLGIVDPFNGFAPGVTLVSVSDGATQSNVEELEIGDLPFWGGSPGVPTRALLLASRSLLARGQAALGAIQSLAPAIDILAPSSQIDAVDNLLQQIDALADGGEHALGESGGVSAVFDIDSLQIMDRIALAYIDSLEGSSFLRATTQGTPDFDINRIADEMAAEFRQTIDKSSAMFGTALMIGAGVAYLAGFTAVVVPAATIGAIAFMVNLGVGTAISTILEAGPDAMLDGRAEFEDFRETLGFVGDRIKGQIISTVGGHIGGELFGPLGGIVGSGLNDTLTTLDTFSDRIDQAYESGELPDDFSTPRPSPTSFGSTRTPQFTPTATPTILAASCDEAQVAGADAADTRSFNLGARSGSFYFQYDTYSQQDRIIILYEGQTLFDTGCVGTSETVDLSYSGGSTNIVVTVSPNCAGGTGTQWNYTVGCPGSPRPSPTPGPRTASMRWGFSDGCRDRQSTLLRLFDVTNNLVWPGGGQTYELTNDGQEYSIPITCQAGATICFGAETATRPGTSWGAGLENDRACTNCCAPCDDVTIRTQNLVCN